MEKARIRRLWCHLAAGSMSLFVVVPLTFWVLDREDPVKIVRQSITGNLVPGGKYLVTWEAVSKRYCVGIARSRIISSAGIVYEYDERPTVIRNSTFEQRQFAVEFELPRNIAPGPARREVHIRYWCNPLQRLLDWPIIAMRQSIEFTILSPRPEKS